MIINTDLVYPIGSIYFSVKNVNPSQYFGGTWVAWGTGRVPVGVDTSQTSFNTVEKTGGENSHQLTNAELPKLSGSGQFKPYDGFACTGIITGQDWNQSKAFSAAPGTQTTSIVYGFTINIGGDSPHNNLQPYITCYMWKRTA